MKRTISSLAFLAATLLASAAPRSAAEALKIAQQFVAQTPAMSSVSNMQMTLSPSITAHVKSMGGVEPAPSYFAVNIEGENGFVIVSGDDRFHPVLGYSTNGSFSEETLPDGLAYWLGSLANEMEAAIANGYEGSSEAARRKVSSAYSQSVAPLVKTTWNQNSPYNNKIPTYMTGCVATGTAQIMKYWNYPERGKGTHTHSMSRFQSHFADFSATTYNWASMKAAYGSKYDTKEQVDAVATLMYHVGIATDMEWGSESSGTPNINSAYALINYFGYNKNLYVESRDQMSLGAWKAVVMGQLQKGNPLCYAGFDGEKTSGHFFILDGYDALTGKYHFNWGWGGLCDGYYAITALEPGEGGIGAGAGNYSYEQQMFVDVQPTETGMHVARIDADAVEPMAKECQKRSIVFNTHHLQNNTPVFKGKLGLALYNTDGSFAYFVTNAVYDSFFPGQLPMGYSFTTDCEFSFDASGVENGTYSVCLATALDDNPGNYFPVRAMYGKPTYYKMEVSGNKVTFTDLKSDYFIDDTAAPAIVSRDANAYQNVDNKFQIKVKNSGTTEFYDEVGVCIQKGDRDGSRQYITIPCSLAPGEEKTLIISGKVLRDPGSYTLVTCYGDNGDYTVLSQKVSITVKDEASSISAVAAPASDAIYTITGIRVQNEAQLREGIYIKNGKKIYIK